MGVFDGISTLAPVLFAGAFCCVLLAFSARVCGLSIPGLSEQGPLLDLWADRHLTSARVNDQAYWKIEMTPDPAACRRRGQELGRDNV